MSRHYLNLSGGAWRQFRRNWKLAPTPLLLWQTWVPGTLFSTLARLQHATAAEQLKEANLSNALVVLGYWRSGTTLLHELLSLDDRYCFPTTHACMNPHHFLLTEASALAKGGASVQRPMDEMEVRPGSPQEDEFAFLSLGARSPYEALVAPQHLREALKLSDPHDLSPEDERRWRSLFLDFMRGVSVRGGGRPLILKSPTHGFRVPTLRELLPDARYVLIARDPMTNFESVVRMWRKMFEVYALGPIPPDDEIREAVLEDRPRFDQKIALGTAGLPANRFTTITYEALAANPVEVIGQLYHKLELGDYNPVRGRIAAETAKRSGYKAKGSLPSEEWLSRIAREWGSVLAEYARQADLKNES
ncbi:MAG: sulfotransferase [Terriglobia bacterium]